MPNAIRVEMTARRPERVEHPMPAFTYLVAQASHARLGVSQSSPTHAGGALDYDRLVPLNFY